MNAVDAIAEAARSTGYRDEAIVRNYAFADVLDPSDTTREVALAAFTQTPPSYRSAALAAVPAGEGTILEFVRAHRALGAPLLFVIQGDHLSLWQVCGDNPRRLHESMSVSDVPALFERYHDSWRPDAIHRAKSIGAIDQRYQMDFVDLGLLPAVEGKSTPSWIAFWSTRLRPLPMPSVTTLRTQDCCFVSCFACSPRRFCRIVATPMLNIGTLLISPLF